MSSEAGESSWVRREKLTDEMSIMPYVRFVGGALAMILLLIFVLTEIFVAIDITSGPFESVANDLESIGATTLGLMVLGILIISADAIMRYFGAGFGGR